MFLYEWLPPSALDVLLPGLVVFSPLGHDNLFPGVTGSDLPDVSHYNLGNRDFPPSS